MAKIPPSSVCCILYTCYKYSNSLGKIEHRPSKNFVPEEGILKKYKCVEGGGPEKGTKHI